ncbi:acyltransferase [Leptospira interrogans]|uniref:acyltransferase family protein n=1 Tax=Leptospira interrogans TaxID=173 RepID=UPI0010C0EEAB|nr:acyltransferase [Leptospira interrogans]QCO36872.1 acyltransferase [Leptospira interrogans]QCO41616.1 acyltransferase [Leptospira interrogans]ULG80347.1 acyltransferase [Leptospira interrogans]ULG93938.1 acyltransferase [Leptospira interrogans]UML67981.1 acyltransferase [Leptospira interrogans]
MKAFIKGLWYHREDEIQSLNGLRAFAIILVILNHYALVWKKPGIFQSDSLFWSGVDLSFVLSGFLISKSLLSDWTRNATIDFKKFYLKRTLRIFPAYYVFITFSWVASKLTLKIAEAKGLEKEAYYFSFKLSDAWGDFVFLGNYFPGINIHTWSLSIEEQFYLIFPLFCSLILFKMSSKYRQLLLWSLLLVPTISRVIVYMTTPLPLTPEYFNEIYFPFHTRFDSLVIGVIVMDLYMNQKGLINRLKTNPILYYLLLFLFFSFLCISHWANINMESFFTHTFKYNLLNIGFAGILLCAVVRSEGLLGRFLSLKIFVPIARLSFTIYLWHLVLIAVSVSILKIRTEPSSMFELLFQFIFVLTLMILLSVPFYLLFEYPFQYLRTRILPKRRSHKQLLSVQPKSF